MDASPWKPLPQRPTAVAGCPGRQISYGRHVPPALTKAMAAVTGGDRISLPYSLKR